jgi:2'-5' RNA ligase
MRCFVACFLTSESALRLEAGLKSAWKPPARARLVPRANYHVTLRFIGDVRRSAVPALMAVVAGLDGRALACTTGSVTGFPRPARARVIAVGVEPASPLVEWARALSGLNPELERRPFVPHVSLARIRGTMTVPELDGLVGLELALEAPALYESVPVDGGVRYQQVDLQSVGSG